MNRHIITIVKATIWNLQPEIEINQYSSSSTRVLAATLPAVIYRLKADWMWN